MHASLTGSMQAGKFNPGSHHIRVSSRLPLVIHLARMPSLFSGTILVGNKFMLWRVIDFIIRLTLAIQVLKILLRSYRHHSSSTSTGPHHQCTRSPSLGAGRPGCGVMMVRSNHSLTGVTL